jgi:predicted dehydrogenase
MSMRVGVVGLGWAARAFHVPALRGITSVRLVGGADSDGGQRATWEKETGLSSFASFDELLDRGRPDAVVIATPPQSHGDLCLRALDAGLHVICEKPFVADVAEADRVLAAAAAAGKQVAVNHEFRQMPIFRAVREQIGAPQVGRLVFCQIWQLMDLAPWDEPVPWRASMPNRTLFEGGVHLIDLLMVMFGEKPAAVYARHSSGLEHERQADAVHLVTLEFSDGRLAQLTIDRLCKAGTRYVEVRADCEHASLRASHGGRAILQLGKKRAEKTGFRIDFGKGGLAWLERGLSRKPLARNPRDAAMHATRELAGAIIAALAAGEEPPSSGREARDVLEVIEGAYRSARTGERVELAPALVNVS